VHASCWLSLQPTVERAALATRCAASGACEVAGAARLHRHEKERCQPQASQSATGVLLSVALCLKKACTGTSLLGPFHRQPDLHVEAAHVPCPQHTLLRRSLEAAVRWCAVECCMAEVVAGSEQHKLPDVRLPVMRCLRLAMQIAPAAHLQLTERTQAAIAIICSLDVHNCNPQVRHNYKLHGGHDCRCRSAWPCLLEHIKKDTVRGTLRQALCSPLLWHAMPQPSLALPAHCLPVLLLHWSASAACACAAQAPLASAEQTH
jgi:hypothetical protein